MTYPDVIMRIFFSIKNNNNPGVHIMFNLNGEIKCTDCKFLFYFIFVLVDENASESLIKIKREG